MYIYPNSIPQIDKEQLRFLPNGQRSAVWTDYVTHLGKIIT